MRVERALVGLLFAASAVAMAGCQGRLAYNLPPSNRLMEPGPGVGGPGPGVIPPAGGYGGGYYPGGYPVGRFPGGYPSAYGPGYCENPVENGGVEQASYDCNCPPGGGGLLGHLHDHVQGHFGSQFGMDGGVGGGLAGGGYGMAGFGSTSQIAFLGSDGVQVSWDVSGVGMFDSVPLVIPGRQDFYQGAIYRLRLTNLPGRPGVELYPTLEIAPVTPRTDAYLAHSPIPIQFTEEDFNQALSGNFVTKVIYLPDPEFQELALAGVETLVSTRLDPGTDPIAEADRRGSILAIVRIGNKSFQAPAARAPSQVVPMSFDEVQPGYASNAAYDAPLSSAGQSFDEGVMPAQYCYSGPGYAPAPNMPLGMPTAGFAPAPVPPNMIVATPEWGMPISGTPIGLPGPPHIPLGAPAGLQQHVMKNRTRVLMPPPVAKVNVSVKQRPGMNYPRPVNRVTIDETHREPFRLVPAWFTDMFHSHR